MGLVADSLDMLADSFVYGISLFAVGGTLIKKKTKPKTELRNDFATPLH